MLSDFLHTLIEFLAYLWPASIVGQWERGVYLCGGRNVKPWRWVALGRVFEGAALPPGVYLKAPWLCEVHAVKMTWDFVESGRFDVILKDGRIASVEVLAKMRVTDPLTAWLEFGDFEIDRARMLRATAAETLSEADPERFTPEKRGRLLGSSLLKAVREAGASMGHEVEAVQVTTFILQPKVLRLLTESAARF